MKKIFATMLASVAFLSVMLVAKAGDDKSCPFQPEELKAVFGVAFDPGTPGFSSSFSGITMTSCRYKSRDFSLFVRIWVYASEAEAKKHFSYQMFAGKMKPVPNDPDNARFQVDQGDLTDPALHYVRGKTAVELRILGMYGDLSVMQQKLLKLRRFP